MEEDPHPGCPYSTHAKNDRVARPTDDGFPFSAQPWIGLDHQIFNYRIFVLAVHC